VIISFSSILDLELQICIFGIVCLDQKVALNILLIEHLRYLL